MTKLILVFLLVSLTTAAQGESVSGAASARSDGNKGTITASNSDKSIAGLDTDNNGVRDDLDSHINSLTATQDQKSALRQLSSAITHAMQANATNLGKFQTSLIEMANATSCLYSIYDPATADRMSREIEKRTVNTKERSMAYMKFH